MLGSCRREVEEDRGAFHVKRWMFAALGRAKRGGLFHVKHRWWGGIRAFFRGRAVFHVERCRGNARG